MTEALIAIAIVAILVVAAIPQYRKTVERNYRQQAQDILTTIYYGEQAYKVTNNKFIVPPMWTDIFMDDPHVGATPPVTFAVPAADATTFTATATRSGGPCDGSQLTITQSGPSGVTGTWSSCP